MFVRAISARLRQVIAECPVAQCPSGANVRRDRKGYDVKTLIYLALILFAALGYRLAVSPEWQAALGASATAIVKPLAIPLVELINVPAFVYVVAVLILLA